MGSWKECCGLRKPTKSYNRYAAAGSSQPHESGRVAAPTPPSNHHVDDSGRLPALSFADGIEVWHDCPDATLDICFVHGLTGSRTTTWTAHGQDTPWPKALLPPQLSRARILTYGYDAYVVRKSVASRNELTDHAMGLVYDLTGDRDSCGASNRPLIFVAHNLGGLVCKKAILLSRNNPEPHLRNIFDCVKGIIFMGTPHRGAWMADWAKIPAGAFGLVKSANTTLLKILETDNKLLEDTRASFSGMLRELSNKNRPIQVTCFREELPLPGVGLVVSKDSATLEGYTAISIHANNSNMVKFGSAEDNGFKRLLGELRRWQKLHEQHQSSVPGSSIKELSEPG